MVAVQFNREAARLILHFVPPTPIADAIASVGVLPVPIKFDGHTCTGATVTAAVSARARLRAGRLTSARLVGVWVSGQHRGTSASVFRKKRGAAAQYALGFRRPNLAAPVIHITVACSRGPERRAVFSA